MDRAKQKQSTQKRVSAAVATLLPDEHIKVVAEATLGADPLLAWVTSLVFLFKIGGHVGDGWPVYVTLTERNLVLFRRTFFRSRPARPRITNLHRIDVAESGENRRGNWTVWLRWDDRARRFDFTREFADEARAIAGLL